MAINIDDDSSFGCAGPTLVSGEDTLAGGLDNLRFRRSEEAQGYLHRILRSERNQISQQGGQHQATECLRRDENEFAPSHGFS